LILKEKNYHITLLLVGLFVAGSNRSAFAPGRVKPKSQPGEPAATRPRTVGQTLSGTPTVEEQRLKGASTVQEMMSQQRRKAEVLAMIRFSWEKLGYEIVFLGPRPGYRAITKADKRRIEVYMRPGESALLQAYDLAHELGHAYDLVYNTPERRRRWRELRGIDPPTPWFPCNRCPDYNTPAGDFAETFAFLMLGPGNYNSTMALAPTPAQISMLTDFCSTDRIGADREEAIAEVADDTNR
jgi:hypothetical protein